MRTLVIIGSIVFLVVWVIVVGVIVTSARRPSGPDPVDAAVARYLDTHGQRVQYLTSYSLRPGVAGYLEGEIVGPSTLLVHGRRVDVVGLSRPWDRLGRVNIGFVYLSKVDGRLTAQMLPSPFP